jgi:uncharacterized damage-inducible protein DinB
MNQKVALFARQYEINRWFITKALKDLSEENIETRPNDKGNSMKWVLGHLVNTRFLLFRHMGSDEAGPFGDTFAYKAELKADADYPSFAEILKEWEEIADKVEARLGELTDDDLSAPMDSPHPIDDGTVLGAIAFLSLHETYHAGQLAYVRRLHGGSQIVG